MCVQLHVCMGGWVWVYVDMCGQVGVGMHGHVWAGGCGYACIQAI